MKVDSNISAPTKFVLVGNERYAYRRFGNGSGSPLLFLQHFTGTLDNWDYAVTDTLALGREVILFDNAGVADSGHGSLFQFHESFTRHVTAFLASDSASAGVLSLYEGVAKSTRSWLVVISAFHNC